MNAPRPPRDPFADDPDAETVRVGGIVAEALMDATFARGLFGLYEVVAALSRRDLEAGVLVAALDLLTAADRSTIASSEADSAEPPDLSHGEYILAEATHAVLRTGVGGVRKAIEALPERDLRAILRDPREAAWARANERRRDR